MIIHESGVDNFRDFDGNPDTALCLHFQVRSPQPPSTAKMQKGESKS
jgi:hypothetical protein